jgi:2-amino-4-hydroxy-6-hydroxymethyldihydropteridine diphosphokinase
VKLVAIGSNISGPWGTPAQTVARAIVALNGGGLRLVKASRLLVTTPFGNPNQPDFVNAVAHIETHLPPLALLQRLHGIERMAGRKRALRWGPRTLDLDIIDYEGLVRQAPDRLVLPHPGIAARIFVLKPIGEIAPRWRHPVSHNAAFDMLRRLKGFAAGREV